ncbi:MULTISPECIES: DNRLRE domain-containing protein [unclassified Streptomyces]|uniref:DNRLRE domain-containing protein n=1 Tax=unclassified Streptomyces TaxID=2593676 RepID=UPI00037B907A|nr:DNRLRE domain-containing protein [Streptomyces sp. 303MFCol5.2]
MERRRFGLPASGRGRAGVAAAVAGAIGVGLLAVPLFDDPGTADAPAGTKKAAARPLDQDTAQRQAVAAGRRVEVTALRDETSTTYARPDGSFELVAHGAPVRARVNGAWKPIDTSLARTAQGWAARATVDPVVFSAGGGAGTGGGESAKNRRTGGNGKSGRTGRNAEAAVYTVARGGDAVRVADATEGFSELATLTSGGHEITLSWPGTLPEPTISGSSALYREVLDGVDLMLTAQAGGFSHVLVVHSAEAAADPALTRLSYGLSSPDLTFHLDPVTKIVTGTDRDGQEIAVSPTPYLWDSAGTYAVTEGADPEPAEESAAPAPSYSEEPGAPVGEESAAPEDGQDTDAPTATATESGATEDGESEDGDTGATTADPAAFHPASSAALTDAQVFALPGLAGPDPGTHMAVAGTALSAPGAASTALSIVPDADLLADADTVYPVFVDPTIYGKTKNWTTAYKKYPSSSFYDGANYNSGTTEARVGFESTTWGLSRSFFKLGWSTDIKGASISSASIRLRETYSWSCSARETQVWLTSGISSKTTWNNQPDWKSEIGTKSFAYGYNSSCPDSYVSYDAKSVAQDAADGGWSSMTIGLRASTEDSAYAWKKFRAEGDSAPKLTLVYNRKPKTPSSVVQTPGGTCDRTTPYLHIGKRDLVLSAASSDADDTSTRQDLKYLDFELWRTGYGDSKILDKNVTVTSAGKASVTVAKSSFTNGYQYSWRVRAIDSSGAASPYAPTSDPYVCRFIYDSSVPNEPLITSTAFPAADEDGTVWSTVKFGTSGNFTFAPDEDTDVTKFQWSFNTTTYASSKTVTAGASTTVSLPPPLAGPNVLYARAVDSAGNVSIGTKYLFYVTPRDTADVAGDTTGDGTPDLFAISSGGNLWMYPSSTAGDLHVGMEAAHDNGVGLLSDPDEDGVDHAPAYWTGADGTAALIAHGGDALGADGIGDVFARMPDGKLYVYPGDGYGSVDISRRMTLRLPSGSPDPATFDQIIVGDYDADGRVDLFATATGGEMWAFEGYTGATFLTVTKIASTAWLDRDLVSVGDHDADGAPDLLWRSGSSSRLYLRFGIKDSAGGSTIASLSTAAASKTGADEVYAEGWSTTTVPTSHLYGTPDVNDDGIPDLWALSSAGSIYFYKGGAAVIGTGTAVISADSAWATTKLRFG